MKYWNKSKEVRLRCWHKVLVVPILGTGFGSPREAKITLQRDPNPNKFYVEYNVHGSTVFEITVWFERAEDATYFGLKYGQ